MSGVGDRAVEAFQRGLAEAGVRDWEIYYEEERELALEVQDGEVEALEAAALSGVGLRIWQGERCGFAYTSELSAAAARSTIEVAQAAARACDPEPLLGLTAPEEASALPNLALCDRGLAEVPQREKIGRARAMEAAARATSPRVARVRKASYGEGRGRVRLVSSRGLDLTDEATLVHCDVLVVAQDGDDEQLGWDATIGHFLAELDWEGCGRRAAARAVGLLGAAPLATGRYAVVLDPRVVCEILEVLSDWLLGESVAKHRSLLAGRQGQTVASPLLTIVDDGTHPRGAASSRFDGEGMPRRRTVVIRDGRLEGFLYDRLWGRRQGQTSTGNSDRSSFRVPPGLSPSNLLIEPGAGGDTAALCRLMGEGLLVGELIGVHTADPVSGDFSLGATGQKVQGGEVAQAVAGVTIAGNLLGVLASVQAVGSEMRYFGGTGAPALLIAPLTVAGD
jgi:PmbA protein